MRLQWRCMTLLSGFTILVSHSGSFDRAGVLHLNSRIVNHPVYGFRVPSARQFHLF